MESADAAYCHYEYLERSVDEKIKDLGPYGDPRDRNGPLLSDGSVPSRIDTYQYEDYRGIKGLAENIASLNSEDDAYGNLGVITGPNAIEVVTNFRKGKAYLITFDDKGSDQLNGYLVYFVTEPDPETGLFPKHLRDPLPADQAVRVLQDQENLVDQALYQDRRTWFRKAIDWFF